ncbi:MAG: DUF5684 domain-containing protein [Bacteroidales bacterium]|jgi:hypothetical protein|nr:DUF5684 domain-containing protein [Bacteroidales bacterium]
MAIFIPLALMLLMLISMWRIFTKAGKPGWAVIVPIYNIIVLLEIIGKPLWWILLFLIPGVNFIFMIWMWNLLSLSFGKNTGFTVGLLLLPFIFIPLLGLGSAKYVGPAAKEAQQQQPVENNIEQ